MVNEWSQVKNCTYLLTDIVFINVPSTDLGSLEELNSLLMRAKEESGKSWLKTQHSKNTDHGIWSHHFSANRRGKSGSSDRFYFLGLWGQSLQPWNERTNTGWHVWNGDYTGFVLHIGSMADISVFVLFFSATFISVYCFIIFFHLSLSLS